MTFSLYSFLSFFSKCCVFAYSEGILCVSVHCNSALPACGSTQHRPMDIPRQPLAVTP